VGRVITPTVSTLRTQDTSDPRHFGTSAEVSYGHIRAYMQNSLTNSQRYLVNAKPGTNHSTNPTNPNGNSKR